MSDSIRLTRLPSGLTVVSEKMPRVETVSIGAYVDAGARHVLIPTTNASDLGSIPVELLDRVRLEFYSDPAQAVFKAFAAASWEEHGAQHAAEFVEEIAQHMGGGTFVAALDELIANANTTQFGREILKLWRDIDAGAPHT